MSSSNCSFLTYIQISQEAGKVIWYSHLLNFPQFVVIHPAKGFSIVSEAEVEFFYNRMDVGSLISGSPAFLNPAWTSGISWLVYNTRKSLCDLSPAHASKVFPSPFHLCSTMQLSWLFWPSSMLQLLPLPSLWTCYFLHLELSFFHAFTTVSTSHYCFTCFWSGFIVHSKTEQKVHTFPYSFCPYSISIFHIPQHLHYPHRHQSGTFVTTDELTLIHHYHPKFIACIRVHSRWCISCGFWQIYNDMYSPLWYTK